MKNTRSSRTSTNISLAEHPLAGTKFRYSMLSFDLNNSDPERRFLCHHNFIQHFSSKRDSKSVMKNRVHISKTEMSIYDYKFCFVVNLSLTEGNLGLNGSKYY